MRILWILPYCPWPTTNGGKLRCYHMLRMMAERGHRLTLLMQTKTPISAEDRAALEPYCERLVEVPRRSLLSLRTLWAVLFSPYPLQACVNAFAPDFTQQARLLLQENWDVVQVMHSYNFQPFQNLLGRGKHPFILEEHNIESALDQALYGRLPRGSGLFQIYDRWRARRWERRVLDQASYIISVSETDAEHFRTLTHTGISVVMNGINLAFFTDVKPDVHSRTLLFLGNYEYLPNRDAVEWLGDEIMPLIWKTQPDVRLLVAGHAMRQEWARRWPDPRIEWVGFVKDMREVQARASLFLTPLRHGGGTKLKVLEAMAAGMPLVSTAQGVSGLKLGPEDYRGGETAAELAEAVIWSLNNPEAARNMGEAGRRYVLQQHDWHVMGDRVVRIYEDFVEGRL